MSALASFKSLQEINQPSLDLLFGQNAYNLYVCHGFHYCRVIKELQVRDCRREVAIECRVQCAARAWPWWRLGEGWVTQLMQTFSPQVSKVNTYKQFIVCLCTMWG